MVSVSILIAITLGLPRIPDRLHRHPVTLALTLAVFYLYGYTLNRITLFALIFSIGILVDDAIVVVENIVRHWRMPDEPRAAAVRRRGRSRRRSRQSHHPGHPDGDRRDPAHGLRRRTDGALHAAHSDRRQRRHGVLPAGRVHRHAVGRRPHPQVRDTPGARRAGRPGHAALPPRHGAACSTSRSCGGDSWRSGGAPAGLRVARLLPVRESEDAAVRQQERVPGDRRHAERHHARRDRARRQRPRPRRPRAAGGRQPADLRRHGLALQLQRPGAALLSAPRIQCRRHPGQSAAQGRPQAAEPRDRQAGAAAPAAGRRALRRAHQGGRSAARAAGAANPGGRSLRPRLDERIAIARRIRDLWKRPTAWWMWTGTWKTTSPSTA